MKSFLKHIMRSDGITGEVNLPPVVTLSVEESPVEEGTNTRFQILVDDPENNIVWWEMDFGNGFKYDGTSTPPPSAAINYDIGDYVARFSVRDHKGLEAYDEQEASVVPNSFHPTFDRDTGRYTSTPGNLVVVDLIANGTDSGSSYVNVTNSPNPGGLAYGGATSYWGPSVPGNFSFIMPASGEVWFFGRHALGDGGGTSNASVVKIHDSGNTIQFSFNFNDPLP